MRDHRTFEIGTGLFVLLGFAALLFLTTQLHNQRALREYRGSEDRVACHHGGSSHWRRAAH